MYFRLWCWKSDDNSWNEIPIELVPDGRMGFKRNFGGVHCRGNDRRTVGGTTHTRKETVATGIRYASENMETTVSLLSTSNASRYHNDFLFFLLVNHSMRSARKQNLWLNCNIIDPSLHTKTSNPKSYSRNIVRMFFKQVHSNGWKSYPLFHLEKLLQNKDLQ